MKVLGGFILAIVAVWIVAGYATHYGLLPSRPNILGGEGPLISSRPPKVVVEKEVVRDGCTVFRGMSFVISDPNCRPGAREQRVVIPGPVLRSGGKLLRREVRVHCPDGFRLVQASNGAPACKGPTRVSCNMEKEKQKIPAAAFAAGVPKPRWNSGACRWHYWLPN